MLELRVLGELELVRDGAPVTLPPSRKTRALLAYLALTRRPHRRERLCEILWDVPDDPRGAWRWSLSKIRPLVAFAGRCCPISNSDFHSWLLGLHEDARKLQSHILRTLTNRFSTTPHQALAFARELVRVDPYDETAWALLVGNLAGAGRGGALRQQYEAGVRVLREVGSGSGRCSRLGERRKHRLPARPVAKPPTRTCRR